MGAEMTEIKKKTLGTVLCGMFAALITVGEFLGDSYELSRLYDSGFSTEFRRAREST